MPLEPFDLTRRTSPWVVCAPREAPLVPAQLSRLREDGGVVRHVDSADLSDAAAAFASFTHLLDLPRHPHDWPALADALRRPHGDWPGETDLAVVVERAHLLRGAPHLPDLVDALCRAGRGAADAVALHFALLVDDGPATDLAPGGDVIGPYLLFG